MAELPRLHLCGATLLANLRAHQRVLLLDGAHSQRAMPLDKMHVQLAQRTQLSGAAFLLRTSLAR